MPDAAPARSGGADPTISSVVAMKTGERPSEMMIEAPTMIGRSIDPPTCVSATRPSAHMASPAPTTYAGRNRARIRGATCDPTMNPAADGSDHSPASRGDRPSTSWRYCATNRK
jgi:hypothetical protein